MQDLGFTSSDGINTCQWQDSPDEPGYCLYTVVDGEKTYGASMSAGLADTLDSGEFSQDPRFVMNTTDFEKAQELESDLRLGSLPTELEIEDEAMS
jgi:preprotein translocase subunit SecD